MIWLQSSPSAETARAFTVKLTQAYCTKQRLARRVPRDAHAQCYMWAQLLHAAAAVAKSLQSCPTLCNPMDCSLPGFSVHGILQARKLQWVAISFFNAWKWKVKVKSLSCVWLLATPWTAAYQAPPSMGFSGQQCWSGVPLPSPSCYIISYKTWGKSERPWGEGALLAPSC